MNFPFTPINDLYYYLQCGRTQGVVTTSGHSVICIRCPWVEMISINNYIMDKENDNNQIYSEAVWKFFLTRPLKYSIIQWGEGACKAFSEKDLII